MRRVMSVVVLAAGAAMAAQGKDRPEEAGIGQLSPMPTFLARIVRADAAEHAGHRSRIHLGHVSPIRTVAGGVDTSPFVTALPGEMWHGRLRSFGAASGVGLSGLAVRARSVGLAALQMGHPVSGFVASELRYGVAVDRNDLLTIDLNAASQRIPPRATIGFGKSIHVGSLYLGAALVHDRDFSLSGGWYRISVSRLAPFDYVIERSAGMPAAGEGARLAFDWRLEQRKTAPARIGLEYRDGDADRDRSVSPGSGTGRERRLLLRFIAPF
jgi:hypothetical protein